jgi:thioredoxin-like negative regulator of GroEL
MAQEFSAGGVDFREFDIDALPELAERFQVTAMPTFYIMKGPQLMGSVVGPNIASVRTALESAVVTASDFNDF